jgi:hypothetical protein
MKNLRHLALVLMFAGLSCAAARAQARYIPTEMRKGYATIEQDDLRAKLTYLSSDKLAGRMSLQPGDDLATLWIAAQFAKAGIDPAVTEANGLPGYLQTFSLVEYRPDRAATTITLTRAGKDTVWHAPQAFGTFKHAVDITAPVVFAGYGITAPELGYDDYAGLDAKGKIVFVFDHEPQEDDPHSIFNGTGNTRYATTRVKLLNAQAHGAVALVVVAEPNRKHPTNAERAARIGGSITRATPLPLQAIENDTITIPSILIVDEVAKELLATSGTTGSALQTALDADLKPHGKELPDTSLTLHLRNTSEHTGTTSNVAGILRGSDGGLAPETIIISGHHDHDGSAPCPAGQGGVDDKGQPTPPGPNCVQIWHGADDNGSGTVGVIELAKAFSANKDRPRRSILFVVFASEERGLLGSYWMAAHPLRPLATTRAIINFDMIGRDEKPSPQTDGLIDVPADTSNRLNLIGAPYSPDYDRIVRHENQLINLTLDDRFDHDSALNVLFRSDQFPFLLHNIPAFWWFTGFHPDYHHITDTVEKIDFPKMQKILQLAYLVGWRFAQDPTPPRFISNPEPAHADAPSTSTVLADTQTPNYAAPDTPHLPVTPVDLSAPPAPPRPKPKVRPAIPVAIEPVATKDVVRN